MKYKICYQYSTFLLGCDCCSDSSSEIYIYDHTGKEIKCIEYAQLIENEYVLREYIESCYPEYKDFEVDFEYTRWF